MIRLGGAGVPVVSDDPWEIALAHKQFGYSAAYCPKAELGDKERINEIRKAFQTEDVLIAEVGAWCNMVDPDEQKRNKNLQYVCERLALADEVGALGCVDYIGSVAPNADYAPHPFNLTKEGFELCVETVRKVIDAVKPVKTKFALEFMQWVLPDSAESCLELIKAIDRPQFGAHIDPVNIILTPRQYFNNGELIKNCFHLLGPWIVSCHAKDIVLRDQLALHFDETLPGTGMLDYNVYLKEIAKMPREVPLLLEHLQTSEQYAKARDNIVAIANQSGLTIFNYNSK